MDNLTRDVLAAEQAGMSYGQWKAFHPYTDPDKKPIFANIKVKNESQMRTCPQCGDTFYVSAEHVKYCSTECRILYHQEHNAESVRKSREKKRLQEENDV